MDRHLVSAGRLLPFDHLYVLTRQDHESAGIGVWWEGRRGGLQGYGLNSRSVWVRAGAHRLTSCHGHCWASRPIKSCTSQERVPLLAEAAMNPSVGTAKHGACDMSTVGTKSHRC
jgi:hypothetical protein